MSCMALDCEGKMLAPLDEVPSNCKTPACGVQGLGFRV